MNKERKEELLKEVFDWVSEMWNPNGIYEWCKNIGMTEDEIQEEFCFFDEELKEAKEYYAELYED